MRFHQPPAEFAPLRNLYWHLRSVRSFDGAGRRRFYRRIRVERERLVASGYSAEYLRLYCFLLADPLKLERERRLLAYVDAVLMLPFSQVV